MGVGDSLEAALTLAGPIAAGTWHLIGDGIVLQPVDIRYEVIWRHGIDTPIVDWEHHFDPIVGDNKFDATAFDGEANGAAVPAASGDQLVLRFSAPGADGGAGSIAFIPNGDGANSHGRIPSLILPH